MENQSWYTGGYFYYIIWSNGHHEIRKSFDDESEGYEVEYEGNFDKCIEHMELILRDNYELDNGI